MRSLKEKPVEGTGEHATEALQQSEFFQPDNEEALKRLQLMLLLYYPRMGVPLDHVGEKFQEFFAKEIPDAIHPDKTDKTTFLAVVGCRLAVFTSDGEEYVRGKPLSKDEAHNMIESTLMSDLLDFVSSAIIPEDNCVPTNISDATEVMETLPPGILTPGHSCQSVSSIDAADSRDLLPMTTDRLEELKIMEIENALRKICNQNEKEVIPDSVCRNRKRKNLENSDYSLLHLENAAKPDRQELKTKKARREVSDANVRDTEKMKERKITLRKPVFVPLLKQKITETAESYNYNSTQGSLPSSNTQYITIDDDVDVPDSEKLDSLDSSVVIGEGSSRNETLSYSELPEHIRKFIGTSKPKVLKGSYPKKEVKAYNKGLMENWSCVVSCGNSGFFVSFEGCVYCINPQNPRSKVVATAKKLHGISLPEDTLIYGEIFTYKDKGRQSEALCVFDCGLLESNTISSLSHERRIKDFMNAVESNKSNPKNILIVPGKMVDIKDMFNALENGKLSRVPLDTTIHPEISSLKLTKPISEISFYIPDQYFLSAVNGRWSWRWSQSKQIKLTSRVSELLQKEGKDQKIFSLLVKSQRD